MSRVEGIVRGGKDVVVSLHGRGSFTRFTCLFLEWMRWGYETEPKGTASIAHFIHLSWLLPSGLYVCRERKVMRRRWAGVPFPFTHRHLRPAHHHHFPPHHQPLTTFTSDDERYDNVEGFPRLILHLGTPGPLATLPVPSWMRPGNRIWVLVW